MIYTCYDMIEDCRAGKPAGWRYLVRQYVPVIRRLLVHYFPDRATDPKLAGRVLVSLRGPESSLFANLEPVPERIFVAGLRQRVLRAVESERPALPPGIPLDLDTLTAALEPLTMWERQAVWLETMHYDSAAAAPMLRADAATVQKTRERALELLRGRMDAWRRAILAENGPQLARAAAAARTEKCPGHKPFLDILDGRMTWRGREELERHVASCWHCIDNYCRLIEVLAILKDTRPLPEPEAAPFEALLGIQAERPALWRRILKAGE